MTEIAGRTALVTGAGSGIGRRMALGFGRLGARVVIWDLDGDAAERVRGEVQDHGGLDVAAYVCDVSDREAVYETAERVRAEVGEVDLLVNNAGIVSGRPFLDNPDEHVERTFAVNTLALYWVTKAFLPGMVARNRGHVVTIASAGGIVAAPRLSDYSASKFAAIAFDESLRLELRQTAPGVRTTVVCPYYIHTGMFHGIRDNRVPWLIPILDERTATTKIVDAILRDKRRLLMPPAVAVGWIGRILPPDAFDKALSWLGITDAMTSFVGRTRPEDLDE